MTRSRFARWDEAQVWLYSRGTREAKLLIEGGADARYVSSGHLLYVREGALLAVPFDLERLEVTGGAVGVVPEVMQAAYIAGLPNETGVMQVSVSATGTLVYLPGGTQKPTEYEVHALDRTGQGKPLPIPPTISELCASRPMGRRWCSPRLAAIAACGCMASSAERSAG